MRSSLLAVGLAVLLILAACRPTGAMPKEEPVASTATDSSTRPQVVLPGGTVISVELATDDETRAQGLMYRESLDPQKGMLFLFPATGEYPFWMKSTMIPLDIIWLDEGRKIVHIKSDVPPCPGDPCPSYAPGVAGRFVLELKAGEAARLGLKPGDTLELRNVEGVVVR